MRALVVLALAVPGCVVATVPGTDAGIVPGFRDAPARDAPIVRTDAGPPPRCEDGSSIGEPCTTSSDCDDHCFCNGRETCEAGACAPGEPPCESTACADASCTEAAHCALVPDATRCDDGDPCNGAERCDSSGLCRAGAPPTCNDADLCTVDFCDPGVGCVFSPYDGDGDGAVARSCGGDDCDDLDASIAPGRDELCTSGRDEDCDGAIDVLDSDCVGTNDRCATAEDVTPTGLGTFRYRRSTSGFAHDVTLPCTAYATDTRRTGPDAFFSFHLDAARDVTIAVEGVGYDAGLLLRTLAQCATGPDLKCSAPTSSTTEPVIHRRRLPAGDYAIAVVTRTEDVFTLALTIEAPSAVQADVCAPDALDVSAGGTFSGSIEDDDYDLGCHVTTSTYGEAAHLLVVPPGERRDVHARATARTAAGSSTTPYVELTRACGTLPSLACDPGTSTMPAEIDVRDLPEGTYYLLVESTAATGGTYQLDVEVRPAIGVAAGESCAAGVPVAVTESAPGTIELGALEPDPDAGEFCGANRPGYRDAFFAFDLATSSDVLVRTTSTARHWIGVSRTCGSVASPLDCAASASGVAEARFVRLGAGRHYVSLSTLATSGTVTAEIAVFPPTPAPPNDLCAGAATLVDGTPSDLDLSAYSDDALVSCGGPGATDAYYTFTLTAQRFVTLRAEGARSMALLRGGCSATPMCATGTPPQIAGVLDPDVYVVVVESPRIEAGAVRLRFTTADP